jgi:hypothetical protein
MLTLFSSGPAMVLPLPNECFLLLSLLARGLLIALMMETASTCETSVNFYQANRRCSSEERHIFQKILEKQITNINAHMSNFPV